MGIVGDCLLIIGIVTAVINVSISRFTPSIWIALALVCDAGVIFLALLRIVKKLEEKRMPS